MGSGRDIPSRVTLVERLEEYDTGGHRQVERIEPPGHWDAQHVVATIELTVPQPGALRAEGDDNRSREVGGPV